MVQTAGLKDNSSEYDPDRTLEDFSKEFILKLSYEYISVFNQIMGYWWLHTQPIFSEVDAAKDLAVAAFVRYARETIPKMAEITNIKLPVSNVVDTIKVCQLMPDGYANPDIYCADNFVRTPNNIIIKVIKCQALEVVEESMPDQIDFVCREVEPLIMPEYYASFNPDMKVESIKLPPRKGKDDCPCMWEAYVEPRDGGVETMSRTKEEEIPGEIPDNSGPFEPNRRLEDFNKGFLVKLAREYCSDCMKMFKSYEIEVQARAGTERTIKAEIGAWTMLNAATFGKFAELSNIPVPVTNAIDAIKVTQILFDGYANPRNRTALHEVKSHNHVVITCTHCGTLEYNEKHQPEIIVPFCQKVEPAVFQSRYATLNPNFQIIPLKLPPREKRGEVACQWELKLRS